MAIDTPADLKDLTQVTLPEVGDISPEQQAAALAALKPAKDVLPTIELDPKNPLPYFQSVNPKVVSATPVDGNAGTYSLEYR